MENAKTYTVEDMAKLTQFLDSHLLGFVTMFNNRYLDYCVNPDDKKNNRRLGELAFDVLTGIEELDKMYPEVAVYFKAWHSPAIEHAEIIRSKDFF